MEPGIGSGVCFVKYKLLWEITDGLRIITQANDEKNFWMNLSYSRTLVVFSVCV